jgi:endonuclease/exonuclease/phosphatase family metal-dependent hydrolase
VRERGPLSDRYANESGERITGPGEAARAAASQQSRRAGPRGGTVTVPGGGGEPDGTDGSLGRAGPVVATYNIHRAVGSDGRFDPERVAQVLHEIDPQVVALQEVQTGSAGRRLLHEFAEALRAEAVSGMTMQRHDSEYGNALLSRLRVLEVNRIDLSVARHEPRGALDVVLDAAPGRLRVLATHLGLWPYERRRQVRQLLAQLDRRPNVPTVLMGDLNEWFLWGRPLRWLHARFQRTPAPATFPARRPVFALDRLWIEPRVLLAALRVHDSRTARMASDHLPLVATLRA